MEASKRILRHTLNAADHARGMALIRDLSPGTPNPVDGQREPRINASVVRTSFLIRSVCIGSTENDWRSQMTTLGSIL